ncbi:MULTISPECIES: chemotaxis protein CheW [Halorussus]|uniref:chemotaxis protein CheW n=1 Tax=Halorussus TaxID=1070314 RepID=UPI000E2178DE|nr:MULTISPECIES: chemotaxis protein CheW [Halorussus]NHN57945.1 purine-binding chemotaxis protein CheW [Halorussus sp. JP-T4]
MSGELSSATTTGAAADRREWVEFVRFGLGGDEYGLELGHVERVLDAPAVTPVPHTGPAIAGVANLGGRIPVVVDGRALLDLPPRASDEESTLLVLDRSDARPTGLLVDEVAGIDARHVGRIETPTSADWEPPANRRWFRAVVADPDDGDDPLGVLDLDALVDEARAQA